MRKYQLTLGELIDRLTINQIKQVKIPAKREEITQEINDILEDITSILTDESNKENITADFLRNVIILAQYNLHIWQNEANWRNGIREGNNLELTHGLNSIRNQAKNKIQNLINGRQEHKIDNVEAFPEWVPSGF